MNTDPAILEFAFRRVVSRVYGERPLPFSTFRPAKKVTRKKGLVRFPGIMEFTRKHGLDRTHVWRVLAGKRESRRLLRQWQDFQSQKKSK